MQEKKRDFLERKREVSVCVCVLWAKSLKSFTGAMSSAIKRVGRVDQKERDLFIYIFFKLVYFFLFFGLKFDLFRNRWDFLLVASGGASGLLQLAVMAYSYRSLAA
jgi:hypothetical protein